MTEDNRAMPKRYLVIGQDGRVVNVVLGHGAVDRVGFIEQTDALAHVRRTYVYDASLDEFVDPSATSGA